MKYELTEKISIPEGVTCEVNNNILKCTKGSATLEKSFHAPKLSLSVEGNELIISCKKANRVQGKISKTFLAHLKNLFTGLDEKFVYKLEAVNVHFPMTFKIEKNIFIINNFLGEKVPRKSKILPNVDVEIKGQTITITSHSREDAGQTAANLENATKVGGRDKRVFQDGIYITTKPGREQ